MNGSTTGREVALVSVDTNSADDSKGIAFGLSGNLFLPVIAAGVVSIVLVTLLLWSQAFGIVGSVLFGAQPFALTLLLVTTFFQGKPPHYAGDWFESLTSDGSFVRHPYAQPSHPMEKALKQAARRKSRKN